MVIVVVVLALALTALYLNRRLAAREILVGWLDRQGIDADVEVERLELNGFVGKITIGDPDNPQVKVDRVEVDYALALPWSKSGLGVTPSRIRLVRPVARASFKDGKLSLGALDPLIEDFTSRPPKPDSRAPLVLIEKGQALVDTDYGPVQILADARIDNSRLMALKAHMPRTDLKSGDLSARGLSLTADLVTRDDQSQFSLKARADTLSQGDLVGQMADLDLAGTLPYPDAKTRQSRGQLDIKGQFLAQSLGQGDTRLDGLKADLDLESDLKGWINTFTLAGSTNLALSADRLVSAQTTGEALSLTTTEATLALSRHSGRDVQWQVRGPADLSLARLVSGETRLGATRINSNQLALGGHGKAVEITGPAFLTSDSLSSGELSLGKARGQLQLDMVRDSVTRLNLAGDLSVAEGRFAGLGPVKADDAPELAALKQSLSSFSLKAPSVRLRASNAGVELNLLQPMELAPRQGGRVQLLAGPTPLMALSRKGIPFGSAKLVSHAGGGLPEAEISINRWQQVKGGIEARLSGKAAMDFGPARGIELSGSGLLTTASGITRFVASDCMPVAIREIELGENDLQALSGKLCASGEPLLHMAKGRTRLSARLADVAATAPAFDVEMRQGRGLLTLDSRPDDLGLTTQIEGLNLVDLSEPARFRSLDAVGKIVLAKDQWSGSLDLSREQARLGQVGLHHDAKSGEGRLDIQTPDLVFNEGGLQPDTISPVAAQFLQSPVTGSARFEGQFQWSKTAATSQGRLIIPDLDFTGPAGKVEGMRGTIDFTSLAPLTTAEGQRLRIQSLQTVVPLTNLDVQFSLKEKWLELSGGTINAAGGQISIEPFNVPLDTKTPWDGVIVVNQVQLNELLKTAKLEDKAYLDAVVSGRLPFRFIPDEGWKIIGGQLGAIKPGRLSIAPEVFDELATGDVPPDAAVPPNTMQDLAYQAMQDLAISDLTADVNSLENGRLGVRFRINGRHDPPQREQLRLTLMELIRRDFLKKKLTLPSDTPIDLTLDTTWNANQIASDLMTYIRRGEPQE